MDYSKMSDFEINKRVAIAEGLLVQEIDDSKATGMTSNYHELRPHTVWVSDGDNPWEQYAPTRCWEDAGPIIIAELIALKPVALFVGGHRWFASKGEGDFGIKHADENPLRAAMIVFLMTQESANVPANPTGTDLR